MLHTTGKAKSLDDITLNDAITHPIWVWALDEEKEDGQDETWQKPVISTDNLTSDIFDPIITLKIKDSELYATASFDYEKQSLDTITVWKDGEWIDLSMMKIKPPVVFISIAKINDVSNAAFICNDLSAGIAKRNG
ncbi:MAG: hypothetical protein QM726_14810 [Chitinophagaceae bacterium]